MSLSELVTNLGGVLERAATVKTVYGEPVTVEDRIVIPVAEVRYGFGAGVKKTDGGGRAGGGVVANPAGALEITLEGTRFIEFKGKRKLAAAAIVGFVAGALVLSIVGTKRVEIVKRP